MPLAAPVIRQVARILLPSTRAATIRTRCSLLSLFMSLVYVTAHAYVKCWPTAKVGVDTDLRADIMREMEKEQRPQALTLVEGGLEPPAKEGGCDIANARDKGGGRGDPPPNIPFLRYPV